MRTGFVALALILVLSVSFSFYAYKSGFGSEILWRFSVFEKNQNDDSNPIVNATPPPVGDDTSAVDHSARPEAGEGCILSDHPRSMDGGMKNLRCFCSIVRILNEQSQVSSDSLDAIKISGPEAEENAKFCKENVLGDANLGYPPGFNHLHDLALKMIADSSSRKKIDSWIREFPEFRQKWSLSERLSRSFEDVRAKYFVVVDDHITIRMSVWPFCSYRNSEGDDRDGALGEFECPKSWDKLPADEEQFLFQIPRSDWPVQLRNNPEFWILFGQNMKSAKIANMYFHRNDSAGKGLGEEQIIIALDDEIDSGRDGVATIARLGSPFPKGAGLRSTHECRKHPIQVPAAIRNRSNVCSYELKSKKGKKWLLTWSAAEPDTSECITEVGDRVGAVVDEKNILRNEFYPKYEPILRASGFFIGDLLGDGEEEVIYEARACEQGGGFASSGKSLFKFEYGDENFPRYWDLKGVSK